MLFYPFRAGHVGLADPAFDEGQESIAHRLAGIGERKVGRANDRAGQIDRRLDQCRLGKGIRPEIGQVAYGQYGAAGFVSHRPHLTDERIGFQNDIRRQLCLREDALEQGTAAVGDSRQHQRQGCDPLQRNFVVPIRDRLVRDNKQLLPEERLARQRSGECVFIKDGEIDGRRRDLASRG